MIHRHRAIEAGESRNTSRNMSSIFARNGQPPLLLQSRQPQRRAPQKPGQRLSPQAVANLHEISLAFRPNERQRQRIDHPYMLQFISARGNEYFCEIDEEYLTDRFNLTGLNTEVQYYQYALDLITDVFDLDADDELREQIEKSARHLYGLVHARYIVTTRGLAKMVC